MTWLQGILQAHPEIAFFLVLGLGYLFGKIALGSFKLGAVTGTLLAGVLVGQLGVSLPNEVKQCFFLLFLFAIGFRTGPQFFRGLKSDGLAHAALAAIVATTGLVVAWLVAGLFGYDAGTAAGLVAGALTESATIGTAMDAIARLDLSGGRADRTQQQHPGRLRSHVPRRRHGRRMGAVATGAEAHARGPRRGVPQARGADAGRRGGQASARREHELRAYAVDPGSRFVGRSVADLEASAGGARIFVEQLRRRGQIVEHREVQALQAGDVVAVSGPRTTLVEVLEAPDSGLREVDDRELLDVPGDVVDVVVTNKAIDGRTLARTGAGRDIARRVPAADHACGNDAGRAARHEGSSRRRADHRRVCREHGTGSRGLRDRRSRHGRDGHAGRRHRHRRRRAHRSAGAAHRWRRDRPEPAGRRAARRTGLRLAAFGEAAACSGASRARRSGSSSRSGSTGFVAVVGLNAGPDFVQGLKASGLSLVAAGAITITASLLIGVLARQVAVQDASGRAARRVSPAAARRRLRWPLCRRRRAAPCLRSDTAWPTPWATCCWPSGAR